MEKIRNMIIVTVFDLIWSQKESGLVEKESNVVNLVGMQRPWLIAMLSKCIAFETQNIYCTVFFSLPVIF